MAAAQETCLVSLNGAGAAYMNIFDDLQPFVRDRLRESSVNICMVCLSKMAMNLSGRRNPLPLDYIRCIEAFETGDLHDYERASLVKPTDVS